MASIPLLLSPLSSGPPRSRRAMEVRERRPAALQVHLRPRAVRQCWRRRVPPRRRCQPGHLSALRLRRGQRHRVHGRHGEREHREGEAAEKKINTTGRSNWILLRKLINFMCCLRDNILKIERDLSKSI